MPPYVSSGRRPTSSQTVATRDANTPLLSKRADREDSKTLRESLTSRAERQREILFWIEKLLEPSVERDVFKRALYYLPTSTHPQILHERHLSSLCSYPLCSNPPSKPYESYPTPRSKIFRSPEGAKTIVQISGNEHEGFCKKPRSSPSLEGASRAGEGCARRREWVARRVEGLRREFGDGGSREEEVELGKGWGSWELLEEVEERLEMERQRLESNGVKQKEGVKVEAPVNIAVGKTGSGSTPSLLRTEALPPLPAPSASLDTASRISAPAHPSASAPLPKAVPPPALQSLLSSLQIHERPTPSEPPTAPSFSHPSLVDSLPSSSSSRAYNTNPSTNSSTSAIPSSLAAAREKERRRRLGGGGLVPGGLGLGTVGGMLVGAQKRVASASQGMGETTGVDEGSEGQAVAEEEESEEEEGKEDWDLMELAREEMLRAARS